MSSTEADSIDKLYKNYDILNDAKDKISEHEKEYREIIEAVKGSEKEKRLASQFIGKFFKFFPSLADAAIDASLDLCEDENIQIRRQAIRDLPLLCKDTKEHIPKIGDILAQLLVVDDPLELQQVHMSLQQILKFDAKSALAGIFSQILTGDELTRDRCFKFLGVKLKQLGKEIITDEIEAFIIEEVKKVLQDVTADEFQNCMNILASTKLSTTPKGQSELVALAVEQAELNTEEEPVIIEDEHVERYILCATHALPYFSTQIESTPFIKYACEKLFPLHTWKLIGANDSDRDQQHLRVLKVFAEMAAFCGTLDAPNLKIDAIFNVLQEYMPLPPITEGDGAIEENPSFKFSHAECLLYALHKLGKQDVDYFQFKDDPNKLKEFRSRLQYLARGTQGYIKKLQEAVKGKAPKKGDDEATTNEYQIKLIALKTTSNISTLIRDLFHNPPIFRSVVQLSWITKKSNDSNKRHAPITFQSDANNDEKRKKVGAKSTTSPTSSSEQRLYKTPSGKFSGKVSNYSNNRNNNRNGNGGGFRQRNGPGKNRNFRRY
ncbi:apoptosis inhibitor 5 homolog [Sitodiplosis mosellana]|uniref:apoptosis inhibitor 5 homolog n=1 Tax=Sitodiplosis mosellana TaxID=263140 RepID=UPI002444F903|nr:apoptosis inhibitor 5 homolog [Sitodiplosis mosellana]